MRTRTFTPVKSAWIDQEQDQGNNTTSIYIYNDNFISFKMLIHFDISAILGISIKSATLKFTVVPGDVAGMESGMYIFIHELIQTNWTIKANDTNWDNNEGVSWTTYDGTNNWITPGGDYNNSIIAFVYIQSFAIGQIHEYGISDVVQNRVNLDGNLHLISRELNDTLGTTNRIFYASSPILEIQYQEILHSLPAGSRGTQFTFNEYNADAIGTQWETIIGGITYIYNITGNSHFSPNVLSCSKKTLNLWLPPFHTIFVRARHIFNNSLGEWSEWYSFESRGMFNSYENFQALNANTQTIIGRI